MTANWGCRVFTFAMLTLAVGATPSIVFAQDPGPPATTTPDAPPVLPNAVSSSPAPADGSAAAGAAAAPKEVEKKWYDAVNMGAFVDTYYSQNWNGPRPNAGANLYHPYTSNTGFNLAWVGVDASVEPDPVGATLQLRFGPAVPNLALGDFAIPGGIGFVQNGFVSWKPQGKDGKVTLILGKFDTVYGAEVAQSHLNINYTRGYLYNLAQPFFHTGLRADIQLSELVLLKLLAVNGWNNTIDNNQGKSFGAQVTLTPSPAVAVSAGYLGGPEEADVIATPATATGPAATMRNIGADSRWRHLVDIVGDFKPTKDLRLMVNGDYVTAAVQNLTGPADNSVSWLGASVLGRYAFSDMWAAGLRGEYIKDTNGQITAPNVNPLTLYTGTLTVEAAPHKLLLIRLDNRIDAADSAVFSTLTSTSKTQFTTTLGVVAKTN